jgi:hypothetical protein
MPKINFSDWQKSNINVIERRALWSSHFLCATHNSFVLPLHFMFVLSRFHLMFVSQRLIKFRKLPRGWRIFFNLGGYRGVVAMIKAMKHECHRIVVSLVYDSVAVSEFRFRHRLMIDELDKLFIDTITCIAIDHVPIYSDTVGSHVLERESENILFECDEVISSDSPQGDFNTSEFNDKISVDNVLVSSILVIDAFLRRFLAASTEISFSSELASCHSHAEYPLPTVSDDQPFIANRVIQSTEIVQENALSSDHVTSVTKSEDSTESTPILICHSRSASRVSSRPPSSGMPNENADTRTSTDDIPDFETLFSFSTADDLESQDISVLISDMIDCVCNFRIDIVPTQTPQYFPESGKDLETVHTFHYDLSMVKTAVEHCSPKSCSWNFYMCVSFYTRIDLVRISAVQSGHELHLLSLRWIDFSSICFPCDSGVRVCLRFQGGFSSLIICQSRYDEIMKIRRVHAARQVESLARDNRIRDCKSFYLKQKLDCKHSASSIVHPENSLRRKVNTSEFKPLFFHQCKEHHGRATVYETPSHMRAKGLLSTARMPYLNLVKLLQSAIFEESTSRVLAEVTSGLKSSRLVVCDHAGKLSSTPIPQLVVESTSSSSALQVQSPLCERIHSSVGHKIHAQRMNRIISKQLVTCIVPQVQVLDFFNGAEASPPFQQNCDTHTEIVGESHEQGTFVLSLDDRSASKTPSCAESCNASRNAESSEPILTATTTRSIHSRGSVTFRLPTAETFDTESASVIFTPQPPAVAHGKLLSPRVIAQRELVSKIPQIVQSPRHYVPQKLVARGRFKCKSVAPAPNQQQQATEVTISLSETSIRGLSEISGSNSSDLISLKLIPIHSIHNPEAQVRLFNTPRRSIRSNSTGTQF